MTGPKLLGTEMVGPKRHTTGLFFKKTGGFQQCYQTWLIFYFFFLAVAFLRKTLQTGSLLKSPYFTKYISRQNPKIWDFSFKNLHIFVQNWLNRLFFAIFKNKPNWLFFEKVGGFLRNKSGHTARRNSNSKISPNRNTSARV